MPKYRLSIERENKTKEIDWSVLLEKEKAELVHDLLGIDRFTTSFVDSNDLKNYLYRKNIIDDVRGKICIVYNYKGKENKVLYGVSYEKDKDFLRRNSVINYINERIDDRDIEFLQRLINKYDNNPIHSNDIILLRNFIEQIVSNNVTERSIKYLKEKMESVVNKEYFRYDNINKRFVINEDGTPAIKYKQFRELGRLCSNHYHRVVERINDSSIDEEVKTKKLDKKQCPGQYNLFD